MQIKNRLSRLSKLSEYLAVGLPVLALGTTNGETIAHVREAGHHVYCDDRVGPLTALLHEIHGASRDVQEVNAFPFPYPHELHWKSVAGAVIDAVSSSERGGTAR